MMHISTPRPIVWGFLGAGMVFALVHEIATMYFFYWYFWWFDIVMHTWGGVLIAVGIHALATLPHMPVRANLPWLLAVLVIATFSWEGFELYFGLFEPDGYVFDAAQDILFAFVGGLLTHRALTRDRIE